MRKRLTPLCSVPIVAVLYAAGAHADTDAEREALARIAHELQRVQLLVAESAKTADTSARIRFRYDWLERDLDLVLRGIADHVDAPRQPRPVPPLSGDYRR